MLLFCILGNKIFYHLEKDLKYLLISVIQLIVRKPTGSVSLITRNFLIIKLEQTPICS